MEAFFDLGEAGIQAYDPGMRILPVSKVKDRLNELVDAAARTHEQVTITKNGSAAAVLVGIDEWEPGNPVLAVPAPDPRVDRRSQGRCGSRPRL